MAKSHAISREVIVKFFQNDNPKSDNSVITRTLGKLGVIDAVGEYAISPKPNEFWRVQIIKETSPSKNSGCFVLAPVAKVEIEDISKLVPGMYQEVRHKGLVIIKPNQLTFNWILPLPHRQSIMEQSRSVYAVLVDLSETILPQEM